MAERSTISQITQWGVETTPGTSVAAGKLLQSLDVGAAIQQTMQAFRGSGAKYPAVAAQGKEWMQAPVSGPLTYNDVVYLLSSVLASATPAQMGATPAYSWDFLPASRTEDAIKTFTVEQGSALRAHKFVYGLVDEFGFTVTRDEANLSARLTGRALQDSITLTPTPTAIPIVPVLPANFSAYLDTTAAGLGTSKLLRVLGAEYAISNRFNPLWAVDAAQPSFVAHVETEPQAQVKLTVEADAAGMARLPLMRAGTTEFVRIEAVGPVISGANTYLFRLDAAVKWTEVGELGDNDGVWGLQYTGTIVDDAVWGKSHSIRVQNTLTAL